MAVSQPSEDTVDAQAEDQPADVELDLGLGSDQTTSETALDVSSSEAQPLDEIKASAEDSEKLSEIDTSFHHEPLSYTVPDKTNAWTITAVVLTILILLAGGGLAVYRLLLRQGSFGQVKLAGQKIERAEDKSKLISNLYDNFNQVTLSVKDNNEKASLYTPADAGIELLAEISVNKALEAKEKGSIWQRLKWWKVTEINAELQVDKDKMAAFVEEKMTKVEQAPTNATLVIENGNIQLSKSSVGRGFIVKNAEARVTESAAKLQSTIFTMESSELKPFVSDEDTNSIAARVANSLAQKVSLTIAGKTFEPSRAEIGSWISPISLDDKKPNLEFNSGEIEAYIDKIAKNYVNPARSEIIMHRDDGSELKLVSGRDGTDVADKDAIAADISNKLLAAEPVAVQLTVTNQAYGKVSAEDYDKWIVVDLTNKYMDVYEKDKKVKTFLVSAGAPVTPTVVGMYKILYKLKSQDMRGQNADGTSYFQPGVQYVNYFYGGYAIHGVYWRPDWWFGQINSSHGCVGLRTSEAKWVYDWAPVGTVVITHL
ncbi:L,D-transpeptidase family protein [Candidatus Saccharibacteria bacterium]|nr:MAG: L,D-transpeptidase family protein [Candidatus Saccharibacteria bacterium]